ncbi:MAG: hypothetical protein AAGL89_05830 [Pseudomonadota bacterium]
MFWRIAAALICLAGSAPAETRQVYLETNAGERIHIASVAVSEGGDYAVEMAAAPFVDHFLSMRPFRCIEGSQKHWCHVPYPYEIARNIGGDLTDLEYDFLFVWKGATEYGINLWNGVYYKLTPQNDQLVGILHEVDMDALGVPPEAGNLRPIMASDLHESDPDSHWLPRMVIE